MNLTQNQLERLQDLTARGELTTDQANVEMVKMMRVRAVSKLSSNVRKALNAAVKSGELAHMKKDGKKPEVYYHPSFDHLARSERNRIERETIKAVSGICV